jgi:flagellar basal body-associated protein FliL
MRPFMLPVVGRHGVDQFVMVQVTLQVAGAETVDRLKAVEPRIRDAIFRSLYDSFSSGLAFNGPTVDVEGVKHQIAEAGTRVVGDGVIEDVLVQRVSQQPL